MPDSKLRIIISTFYKSYSHFHQISKQQHSIPSIGYILVYYILSYYFYKVLCQIADLVIQQHSNSKSGEGRRTCLNIIFLLHDQAWNLLFNDSIFSVCMSLSHYVNMSTSKYSQEYRYTKYLFNILSTILHKISWLLY